MKKFFIVIFLLLIFGIKNVYAITSNEVMYDKDGTQENLTTTINTLYQKINTFKTNGSVTEEKMLTGETAYVKGILVEGSMPNNGEINTTLNAGESYTIPVGYTSGGVINTPSLASQTEVETAVESNKMLNGYQCYANGELVTGTISDKGEEIYTPGTSNQIIAAGQYLSGNQVILGDSDLVSNNIKSGVEIFGVSGDSNVVNTVIPSNNAIDSNIISGKKAYVNGELVTGTMPNNTDTTGIHVPGDSGVSLFGKAYMTIPTSGYYSVDYTFGVNSTIYYELGRNVLKYASVHLNQNNPTATVGFKPTIISCMVTTVQTLGLLYNSYYNDSNFLYYSTSGANAYKIGSTTPKRSIKSINDTGFTIRFSENAGYDCYILGY